MIHRHSLRRAVVAVAAATAASLVLSACGSSSSDSSSDDEAAGGSASAKAAQAAVAEFSKPTTAYPEVSAVAGVDKLAGKTVWWVPISASVPILAAIQKPMEAALATAGMKLKVCDGKFVPTAIAACLSQAADQDAAGVVTGYVDYALVPTAFDQLVSAGVPVLLAGATPNEQKPASATLAYLDTLPALAKTQEAVLAAITADSDAKAKILYAAIDDSPQLKAGAVAAKTWIEKNCPSCEFEQLHYTSAKIKDLGSQISAKLLAEPGTNYVMCEADLCVEPALAGIQTAGLRNKVKLGSANADLSALQRIKAGDALFADAGSSNTYLGWSFTDGILRMLGGSQPDVAPTQVVRLFTADNVKDLDLTAQGHDSIDWYGDDSFQATFTKAWNVK